MGLSKPVAAAVDEACNMVESLVEEFLASQHKLTVVLSNPAVRQFLIGRLAGATGSDESLQGVAGVLPDIERYMKIRSM
jgi:hypothetical protein